MSSHFFAQISWPVFTSVLTVVVLIGAAVIILLSRKREDVHATNTANVAALNGLLNTKKEEVATLEKKLRNSEDELAKVNAKAGKLEEELKAASLEYSQLANLDVAEWLKADQLKRRLEAAEEENRELATQNRQLLRSQKTAD